ncbi:MAG: sigma-70 family RNA polymerase sigma factor [Planctomycetes bacterium]|nr:sigma-70 family RNA polymerase sigma factor [Planctomycetota bacterium]
MRRHLQGRRDAFRALYEKYRDKVYATALKIVGEASLAEDLAQEIFVKIHEELHRFKFEARFSTWLYRIAVNHAINKANEIERHGHIREQAARERACEERPAAPSARFEDERVGQAIDALSPKLRAIIALRYLDGLSYGEIAEVLEVSVGTVKSRLFLAHETLRPMMQDLYDDERDRISEEL